MARTTVTLDADVAELVRTAMAERHAGFKEVVNDALRRGLRRPSSSGGRRRTPTFRMGASAMPLDEALRFAGTLEDLALAERLSQRK